MGWEVDWPQVTGLLVTAGGVAWFVGRAAVAHYLARSLDAHRIALEAKHNTELAKLGAQLAHESDVHRTTMEASNDVELEKLRATLRREAHANETRTAELHRRRAEVVAETYRLLVLAEQPMQDLTHPGGRSSEPEVQAAFTAGGSFSTYALSHVIFLPAHVAKQVEDLAATFAKAFANHLIAGGGWANPGDEYKFNKQDAYIAVTAKIPDQKVALEAEFRRLVAGD